MSKYIVEVCYGDIDNPKHECFEWFCGLSESEATKCAKTQRKKYSKMEDMFVFIKKRGTDLTI